MRLVIANAPAGALKPLDVMHRTHLHRKCKTTWLHECCNIPFTHDTQTRTPNISFNNCCLYLGALLKQPSFHAAPPPYTEQAHTLMLKSTDIEHCYMLLQATLTLCVQVNTVVSSMTGSTLLRGWGTPSPKNTTCQIINKDIQKGSK